MAKSRKDNRGRALRKGETYRKSDGYYTYKFTDSFGRKKYIYSKDLAELRKREEKLKKDQLDGLDIYVMGRASLNFVFDRYIKLKTELRETTRSHYIYTYDRYIREGLGQRKIADIKYSDIVFFYNYLLDNQELAVSSVESVNTVLSPLFDLAVRDDIIRKNPCQGVLSEIKKRHSGKKMKRHPLTVAEQKVFLNCLDEEGNIRWRPLLTVFLGTGCRVGEIIGLRWSDVDLKNKEININHSIVYELKRGESKKKSRFVVHMPKTEAGNRMIPMLDEVHDAFIDEKRMQEDTGISCETVIDGMQGFIFCNRFRSIHNPAGINRAIHRICDGYNAREEINAKKEGREPILLPNFSCHNLRHTFCSRLCERESNVKLIQTIMGHADISTTLDIYAEVMSEAKHESFDRIGKNHDVFRRES